MEGKKEPFMKFMKFATIGFLAISLCLAQTNAISISGSVTDSAGAALPGALVKLEKAGLTAIAKTDGSFTLSGLAGVAGQMKQPVPQRLLVAVHNGVLRITILEKSEVKITVFTLQGKAISTQAQTMKAGTNSIALPHMEAGIYLYKVKAGENQITVMCNSFGNEAGGRAAMSSGSFSHNPAKQAKVMAAISDVIAVTKPGYLNYRVVAYNSDTSGIAIKMIVCADSVKDADGNVYQAVRIGNQVWTVENLRTTKYNDGTPIPLVKDSVSWRNLTTPGFCYYNNNNSDSMSGFGALYNWFTVHTGKLAPSGWHVPNDSEWTTLRLYLILNGYNWGGTTDGNIIAKALAGRTDWTTSTNSGAIGDDLTRNNSTGFSGLPGGYRDAISSFYDLHNQGYWWSATEEGFDGAGSWLLIYNNPSFPRGLDGGKSHGFSVRLLRDF
jgi:uncharacterized protein (TIGR02145 family)